jgi:hypothetical protein
MVRVLAVLVGGMMVLHSGLLELARPLGGASTIAAYANDGAVPRDWRGFLRGLLAGRLGAGSQGVRAPGWCLGCYRRGAEAAVQHFERGSRS